MLTTYTYTKENQLLHPQHYMYTTFRGWKFFDDYRKNREQFISDAEIELDDASLIDFLKDDFIKFSEENYINTNEFLCKILASSIDIVNLSKEDLSKLNFLIKRYEIDKKVYSIFIEPRRPENQDYRNIKNYILLALICKQIFNNHRSFKFLNTLLKINDLLISIIDEIDKKYLVYISYLLNEELQIINKLLEE